MKYFLASFHHNRCDSEYRIFRAETLEIANKNAERYRDEVLGKSWTVFLDELEFLDFNFDSAYVIYIGR